VSGDALALLQDLAPVAALRGSRWVYPIVNAGHIVGIALLFGAIVPLDLRLIGLWPRLPLSVLRKVLLPVAAVGLMLALATGASLFAVNAVKYAAMPLFQAKLGLILLALLNVLAVRRALSGRVGDDDDPPDVPPVFRLAGAVSILLWLSVIVCGRLLAYV